jgi:HlyD family secretion protein
MDIPRKSKVWTRLVRRIISSMIALVAIGGISWYVWQLEPADPVVDRSEVWIDTVKRGPMLREVSGLGKLVPEEIRWVTAATEGRVERIVLEPGAGITPNTVIMELANSQLEQATVNAEWDWKAAETSYEDLKITLESQELTRESDNARLESDYQQALLSYDANSELAKDGLVSGLDLKLKKAVIDQLAGRLEIEKKRLEIMKESIKAQLAVQRTRIDQFRAAYNLKKSQLDQLKVRAGVAGVLQLVSVEVGQRVAAGANLARVANPNKLKAELKIPENQARDIQIGQEASIDTRSSIISGKVARIDPAVTDGTVTVDVALETGLPRGARPDLSVDGTILLERLEDVIYVGRPTLGQPDSRLGLFKLDSDGKRAVRVNVEFGRTSVDTIEVRKGLQPGDQVILSDMTAQSEYDSVRLN